MYDSPLIHTVRIRGLKAGAAYAYFVADCDREFTFTMPPAPGARSITIGFTADTGQTRVSNQSFVAHRRVNPRGVRFAGYLSYADGFVPRWDTFGGLVEPLASRVPILTCGGNHEIGSAEQWTSYLQRWPNPAKGSTNPTWYSKDVGPVHVIALNNYADCSESSLQYKWLARDLASVDRARTPWVIVAFHAPYYCSNAGHRGEAELLRSAFEPLFFDAGVDIVLSGHVHAYERTHPMFENKTHECGTVYLNLGDGGNHEGAYASWLPGERGASAPAWSAFREASFGVAKLEVVNETHALYEWWRNACYDRDMNAAKFEEACATAGDDDAFAHATSDRAWIERRPDACASKSRGQGPSSSITHPPKVEPCSWWRGCTAERAQLQAPAGGGGGEGDGKRDFLLGICVGILGCAFVLQRSAIARCFERVALRRPVAFRHLESQDHGGSSVDADHKVQLVERSTMRDSDYNNQ